MLDLIKEIGAYAGLIAFLGLSVLAFLTFTQARDLRRLRDWAGGAPERDAGLQEVTSVVAAERAEEIARIEEERRRLDDAQRAEQRAAAEREERRRRRDHGLAEVSWLERLRVRFGGTFQGERSFDARYVAALVGGLIVLIGGVTFAALQILGDDDGGNGGASAELQPGDIEVAVLNGTAVFGLADRTSDQLSAKGFKIGKVGNSQSSFEQTVVMFARGSKPEAEIVGKALKISKLQLMTEEIVGVIAGEPVAVIVGQDRGSQTSASG